MERIHADLQASTNKAFSMASAFCCTSRYTTAWLLRFSGAAKAEALSTPTSSSSGPNTGAALQVMPLL